MGRRKRNYINNPSAKSEVVEVTPEDKVVEIIEPAPKPRPVEPPVRAKAPEPPQPPKSGFIKAVEGNRYVCIRGCTHRRYEGQPPQKYRAGKTLLAIAGELFWDDYWKTTDAIEAQKIIKEIEDAKKAMAPIIASNLRDERIVP